MLKGSLPGVHWIATGEANTALARTGAFAGAVAACALAGTSATSDAASAARRERRGMSRKS
jgi:hypothetical protein